MSWWQARSAGIGAGVAQGQGLPTGMLPDIKNQTAWIQVAQRFQVRLELDEPLPASLRVGMTASVSVYTRPSHLVGSITVLVHRLLALFYYL